MISPLRTALAVSALVVAALAAPNLAAAAPPDGSYQQTCRNIDTDKNNGKRRVTAECQDRRGNWQRSRLNYEQCINQRVANDDGTLVCESDGGRLPNGSWSQSCRNGATRNGWLYADCQRTNGGWRSSSIDPRQCGKGGVSNDNGNLVCEGGGGNLPSGSWQQTCRNSNMKGGTLYAQCQRMNGGWRDSSIDPRQCGNRGVSNDNGNLVCEGGGGGNLPGGSWQQTCRNSNMKGGTLYAQCQRMNGSWRDSSIDARQCGGNGGVANNDGNLVCESGGGGGDKLPGGSWQQSCRDGKANGGVLTATCQRMSGNWTPAWINYRGCPSGRVGNADGKLVCE